VGKARGTDGHGAEGGAGLPTVSDEGRVPCREDGHDLFWVITSIAVEEIAPARGRAARLMLTTWMFRPVDLPLQTAL